MSSVLYFPDVEPETVLREGSDVTLVGYGTMINELLSASELLEKSGISAEVIKLGVLKPNEFPLVLNSLRKTKRLVAAEDVCASGCIGSRILIAAALSGITLENAELLNLGEGIAVHGSVVQLLNKYGLDASHIAERASAWRKHEESKT